MNSEMRQHRLEILEKHFQSEIEHDWETCLSTFGGHARYEIMATGQIHNGNAEVLAYHRGQRVAFPDQRHENVRHHFAQDFVLGLDFLLQELDPFLLLLNLTGGTLLHPEAGSSVLKELFLPAIEDGRL